MATLEGSGSQVRLGVSPLSWTNDVLVDLGGAVPLEICLQDAAEIGYQGVELGRKFPRNSEELLAKLSSYGLQLATGWHSGFLSERSVEAEWKAAADHVRLLEECGCQVLVYGECGMLEGDSPWDESLSRKTPLKSIDLPAYAEKLGEFSAGLNQRGIKLAYHHHLKLLVETAEEIVTFCEATRPEVGLLLDTGHAYAGGADYGEILRRFGNRVVHIHLKDIRREVLDWARKKDVSFNSAVREGIFTVPGDGCIDFSEIRQFIKSSGYSGWVIVEAEQDPAKADPRLYTKKAYQYVKDRLL
jgi:inosose dehydratase